MKYYTMIPALIAAFILQLSVVNEIAVMGVSPSLILVFIMITLYLFENEVRCIAAGVIAGFCLDFTVGTYTGVYALTFFAVAVFTVYYKGIFNFENKFSIIPLTLGGTFIYNIIPFICCYFTDINVSIVRTLRFTGISFVYNLVFMYIMYILMIKKASYRPKRSQYERYEII